VKKALIVGGGSENGRPILDALLENNFHIINIGSTAYQKPQITNISVNWESLDIPDVHKHLSQFTGIFNFVFFNQNSSSLNLNDFSLNHDDTLEVWRRLSDWKISHWLSCQLPFLVLHTIRKNLNSESKVGWMLSSYIDYRNKGSIDFADYSSYKYFNYLSMKSFGIENQIKTFGIYPDFSSTDSKNKLKEIILHIATNDQIDTEFKF
jgi:hypothetical protein